MSSSLNLNLIATLERLFRSGNPAVIVNDELVDVAKRLIDLYNSPFENSKARRRGARLVAGLAQKSSTILELVFEDARKYASNQHIDDAFPHSPNSFEVLTLVGHPGNLLVVRFLEEIVRTEWGIPRWAAIEALCALQDPAAYEIIQKIILGFYSPKNFNLEDDLRIIERHRRKDLLR